MRRNSAAGSTATMMLGASVAFMSTLYTAGCSEPVKQSGSTAGSSPSLDSKSADERAAAARDAAKKYGTAP